MARVIEREARVARDSEQEARLRPASPPVPRAVDEHEGRLVPRGGIATPAGGQGSTDDCGDTLFFIASQPHSMSVIQLPFYQPFGGMPPQITAPWLEGLEIKAKG